ncbi:MAG TPA: calcium-binding protein [Stellaceae bacterium]
MSGVGNTPSSPQVFSGNNLDVSGDSGFPALIGVVGSNNDLSGGSVGTDTVWSIGDSVSVADTTSNNLFGIIGSNDTLSAGAGSDTLWAIGNNDIVNGGASNDVIGVSGDNNSVAGGAGNDTVYSSGNNDTVNSGLGKTDVSLGGTNNTFADNGTGTYQDTVTGFDQSAGDRIHLAAGDTVATTTPENGGVDTLVTLSDGSTILLKGVGHVDSSFFS